MRSADPSYAALLIAVPLAILACISPATAAPRLPLDDAEVLERLPPDLQIAESELSTLRRALAREPESLDLATRLARRYIEMGRAAFDPRYFGYAEAALAPWWTQSSPPAEVLLLRAILRQQGHDFDDASADLSALLAQDPRNAQALLALAGIHQLRGEQLPAMRHCANLLVQPQHRFAATICLCKSLSLSGQAKQGYTLLRQALETFPEAAPTERRWAWILLAEMAQRLDKLDEAEQHFQSALMIAPGDASLLMSYADFLLDRAQPERVSQLLANEARSDALLLRFALAERQRGQDATAHIERLKSRFEISRLRGEIAHSGEEARLRLYLLGQPVQALALAQANWRTQREPRDARILLETALAASEPAAAAPALLLIQQSTLEDVQLARLAEQIRAQAQ